MGSKRGTDDDDHRLGMQIDVIALTLSAAEATHDLEQREQLLETAARALEATRREQHEEVERKKMGPLLRLVQAGAGAVTAATVAEWIQEAWGVQQELTVAATAAPVVLASALMGV